MFFGTEMGSRDTVDSVSPLPLSAQPPNRDSAQIKAINKATEAIVNGKSTALLAMATGTGKTRTVLGLIYKMLESKRFRRILFLVDRVSLGEQAMDTFKDVKLKELMTEGCGKKGLKNNQKFNVGRKKHLKKK